MDAQRRTWMPALCRIATPADATSGLGSPTPMTTRATCAGMHGPRGAHNASRHGWGGSKAWTAQP
eukprot:180595-Chlamydomonas_euryale.AAC.2